MKILIIGSNKIYSIENHYIKYLKSEGVNVDVFLAHSLFIEYYHGFFAKLLFRLGISGIYRKINRRLIKHILNDKPDIIWVFKGMEIFPKTLTWAKSKGIKLANFNGDNPFLFTGRGSGNKNVTESLNLYDLHFTYNLEIKKRMEEMALTVSFLPFGFDLEEDMWHASAAQEEVIKVCFLGNPDQERADFILALANKGVEIDVYGHGWKNFVSHPNILLCPPVYGVEQWKVLRKYRVQLNLMRIHNLNSHNMRTFEVPAVGGIMLAPDTWEHRLFFQEGEEVFLFEGVADCAIQIKKIIGLSLAESLKIRNAARDRCLHSGYSYKHRAEVALKELHQLTNSEK